MKKFVFTTLLELEIAEVLVNDFIKPLENLGFTFDKYGHVGDDEDCKGTHILKFTEHQKPAIDTRQGDWGAMIQTCTQDDDSQPQATFRYYAGTLWLYIPYSA
jgi:hypothetical protein